MSANTPRGRNEVAEGSGNARRRWFSYLSSMDPRELEITGLLNMTSSVWQRYGNQPKNPRDEYFDDLAAKETKESAELIGFWVSWHTLGGFDLMEDRGWNRATIYRRIKKFKERYGAHPDDFEFDWINLDVERSWDEDVRAAMSPYMKTDEDG